MLLDRFRLDGKVAIVSGASRGIGRGIARAFAEVGARVVAAARSQSKLDALAAESPSLDGEIRAVCCDVSDAAQLPGLVDATVEAFGGVDILVNNVGGTLPALVEKTSLEVFEKALHFNVGTAFELTRRALPHLKKSAGGGGAIVNISSALSHVVEAGFVSYGSAKAALSHMSRLMAFELAPEVRVNALAVGATLTDALAMFVSNAEWKQKMIDKTPLGRLGEVEDVALAALYLASPASSWVTGKVFEIDGGAVASTFPLRMRA